MTDYIAIKGIQIQKIAGDPSNIQEGDIWYNSSSNALKGRVVGAAVGAWASSNNMNSARTACASAGAQSAGQVSGGLTTSGPAYIFWKNTEHYDGTSWSEVADTIVGKFYTAGMGTTSNALEVSGQKPPTPGNLTGDVEEWDGTSWSETADVNSPRVNMGGFGTTSAAISCGGQSPAVGFSALTESWNGTSWSEVADLNLNRTDVAPGGTQSAGIGAGGQSPPTGVVDETELWDGTSWSETADMVTDRAQCGSTANAPNSNTIIFGGTLASAGSYADCNETEIWDGTSWTEIDDLGTALTRFTRIGSSAGAGTASAGYRGSDGGPPAGKPGSTEDFNSAAATVTFTDS